MSDEIQNPNQPKEHKRRPRRKRSVAHEIACDIMAVFDDLPDAAFFAIVGEFDIDVEDLDDG